jgi:cell division protease FtsH
MSEKVGMVTLERERQPQFIQIQASQEEGDYSEATARDIDAEVRRIIDEQYERVKRLLAEKRKVLEEGARRLLEREVIVGAELKAIMDRG